MGGKVVVNVTHLKSDCGAFNMAASCRMFMMRHSAHYVRTTNAITPSFAPSDNFLLPLLTCSNVFHRKIIYFSPQRQTYVCDRTAEYCDKKVQKLAAPKYKLTVACCYSSSPPTSSRWAIVRLIQKGGDLSEKILYKISPKLHGLYRQFIDGGKAFITDVRFVYRIRGRMKKENLELQDLPWRDIYIRDKVIRDMGKVIPTMIVTWLPFAFYVMLPLIFTFPRQFLSDHFLNKEQLSEFQRKSLKRKFLQEELIWKLIIDRTVQPSFGSIRRDNLALIAKCPSINVEEVLRLRPLFENQLQLEELPRNHLVSLCKLHTLLTFMLPSSLLRQRLEGKCSVLRAIDQALRRDGLKTIEEQDLKNLCFQRVFEGSETHPSTMQVCLNAWLETAAVLKDSEQSLYLHLPLFKKKL